MWRRRYRSETRDSVVLAGGRLLEGDATESFRELGQSVPAWAYVNALAHSQPDRLTSLKTPPLFVDPGGWDAVVAYLATELLTITHGRLDEVHVMQRAVLVPLELDLLAGQVQVPRSPRQLADLVINALHRGRTRDHYV
jgi:hypothetical protein